MAESEGSEATEAVTVEELNQEGVDEVLQLTVPLVDDDLRAGQLGTPIYRSLAENQKSPRSLVTAVSKKDAFHFQVRFHCAQYGTYQGQDACLIVLKLSFQQLAGSWSRFKGAELEVEFEDAENIGLNPFEHDIDTTYRPRVLDYEPKLFQGPISEAPGSTSFSVQLPITAPGGIVGVTPGISHTKGFVSEGLFQIHGVIKEDPPSLAHWVIREDKVKKNGIRPEFSVAMVVNYTPGRRFAARVRFKADVFINFLRPVCGVKDDPIFFDPDFMKAATAPQYALAGQQPLVPGLKTDQLDLVDLRALTRLTKLGGTFGD